MKPLLLLLSLVIIISLISCESPKQVFVTVYDQVSKKPLDSVLVVVKAGKNGYFTKSGAEGYTDSTGKFDTQFMIGCSFGCYDVLVEFHKRGFETLTNFNPKDTSIVYLQPVAN